MNIFKYSLFFFLITSIAYSQKYYDFNDLNYFIDWGGSLIWMAFDHLNSKILAEIKEITKNHQGYYTLIKIDDDFKASADIFTIDPIKYKISEKIKKSFDPKRIFNPGKMYTGI